MRLRGRRLPVLSMLVVVAALGCADRQSDRFADVVGHAPLADASGRVVRHGPIISAAMLPGETGRNINGPSLIAAPQWLANRLGSYYLYFSSHRAADSIRLAYADEITGPWRIHEPGTLRREQALDPAGIIGSPDVVVDHEERRIRMYFNGRDPGTKEQSTFVATSVDGLEFAVVGGRLGPSYSRVLRHDGWHYLFMGASGQRLARSADGLSDLERGPMVLPAQRGADPEPYSRHVALQRVGDVLRVYYTRKRDAPERILMGTIDLRQDWREWKVVGDTEILRPEMAYEGALLPVRPSRRGPGRPQGENALRDPAIFEEDGRTWLLYTFAGERGIALAEVLF